MSLSVEIDFDTGLYSVTRDNIVICINIHNNLGRDIVLTKISYKGSCNYAAAEIPILPEKQILTNKSIRESLTLRIHPSACMETLSNNFPILLYYRDDDIREKIYFFTILTPIHLLTKDIREYAGKNLRIAIIGMKGATK